MNCHHARQLISPYLDQQLTGREMLALQDHFAVCLSCERERQSIRQVKALLRGLREPSLPRDFSGGIALRLEKAEAAPQGWHVLCLPMPKPQRGRRLATALALSCLTALSFAAPFAPDQNAVHMSSSLIGVDSPAFAVPAAPEGALSSPMSERMMWVSVNDLTLLPPAQPSTLPSGGALMLTGMDLPPTPPGLETAAHSPETSFGAAQFAVFRPR